MPITRQAEKKLRHDKKAKQKNALKLRTLRTAVKAARTKPSAKTVSAAYIVLDKSAKTHVIHKNKAARLKSRLSKLLKK